METRKRTKIFNVLMAVLIAVIVFCGTMTAGALRGWFSSDSFAYSEDVKGIVNIERSGVGYTLDQGSLVKLENEADVFQPHACGKIPVKLEDKILVFDPQEIDYAESVGGKCRIVVHGSEFITPSTMEELEDRLAEAILNGEVKSGDHVEAGAVKKEIRFYVK